MFMPIRTIAIAAAIGFAGLASAPAFAEDKTTTADIEKHLGVVPEFFQLFSQGRLPGVWTEFKTLELNPATALDAKTKELIALAVSAQIPCAACLYFHAAAATANGATGREIQEAVGMSVMTGTWSKVLTSEHIDLVRKDTNALVSAGRLMFNTPVMN
jgi:AhpD family alkylhydroperoxidase